MAANEDSAPEVAECSIPSTSAASANIPSESAAESGQTDFAPMYHAKSHVDVEFEDYFKGPRDPYRHSKWPTFLRMHGSVLPKMIVPLTFVAAFATAITLVKKLVYPIGINNLLLTVTGFTVSLALSFKTSTAYERYSEGRKYWADLILTSRNLARLIWVHAEERHAESEELGKNDLLAKLAALNLLNAFAVSVKHRLRFEPSVEYPDLAPLVVNLHTLAGDADQNSLRERKVSPWKAAGQYLGIPMAESNPRKLIRRSKENLGNTPLEICTYLACYIENVFKNQTLATGTHQVQAMGLLSDLTTILTGMERIVNTPLPVAYSISISQISWAYVLALPFQLVDYLGWVTIGGTVAAGYIILGLAQIGRELENPFGQDVNDLPLDSFCAELANDIDALTSRPAPLNNDRWMKEGRAKVLWPLSVAEWQYWESRSTVEIRHALAAKAASRDVKVQRKNTMLMSEHLTNGSES